MNNTKFSFFHNLKLDITLENLKLTNIPTQNSLVFMIIKQYRTKKNTESVKITKNEVDWTNPISLKCQMPRKIKNATPRYFLHFSVRLENASGNGYKKYGVVDIDLSTFFYNRETHFQTVLKHCIDNSALSGDVIYNHPSVGNSNLEWKESMFPTSYAIGSGGAVSHFSLDSSPPPPQTADYSDISSIGVSEQISESFETVNTVDKGQNEEVPFTLYDAVTVKVKTTELKKLENQVNNVVADLINNAY